MNGQKDRQMASRWVKERDGKVTKCRQNNMFRRLAKAVNWYNLLEGWEICLIYWEGKLIYQVKGCIRVSFQIGNLEIWLQIKNPCIKLLE